MTQKRLTQTTVMLYDGYIANLISIAWWMQLLMKELLR